MKVIFHCIHGNFHDKGINANLKILENNLTKAFSGNGTESECYFIERRFICTRLLADSKRDSLLFLGINSHYVKYRKPIILPMASSNSPWALEGSKAMEFLQAGIPAIL